MEGKNIHSKLIEIQSRLKAPKNQFNKFGKYSYRSCEDILEAVKPLLTEVGATLVIQDEIIIVGDRYYIRSIATLTDAENPEDYIKSSAYAREDDSKAGMAGAQLTGATSSYARKYCLNGLFCIDDCKDADTNERHEETTARTQKKVPCSDCGKTVQDVEINGKRYTSASIIKSAQTKFGKPLCYECYVRKGSV